MTDIAQRVERKRGISGVEWFCSGCGERLAFSGLGITRNGNLAIRSGLRRRRPDLDGIPRYGLDRSAHRDMERYRPAESYITIGNPPVIIYCMTPSCSDRLQRLL